MRHGRYAAGCHQFQGGPGQGRHARPQSRRRRRWARSCSAKSSRCSTSRCRRADIEPLAVEGLVNMPYAIPNMKVDAVLKDTAVSVMFWRSVGGFRGSPFAVESFIDELAHEAGQDTYQFRRKMSADKPEFHLAVLDMLAEKSNWSTKMPAGKGRGIANARKSFGTIVGECVEVAINSKGRARCERVVAVVNCGHVVNPRNVEMQIESGVIYRLTAALFDEITIQGRRGQAGNFDSCRMGTRWQPPKIETYLALSGGTKWGGIGGPRHPADQPLLCNRATTGKRVRELGVSKTHSAAGFVQVGCVDRDAPTSPEPNPLPSGERA